MISDQNQKDSLQSGTIFTTNKSQFEKEEKPLSSDETIFERENENNEAQSSKMEETVSDEITPESISETDDMNNNNADIPPVYTENRNKLLFVIFGTFIFVIVLFLIMSLFFRKGSIKKERVELQYWGLWEDKSIMQPVIEAYQTKNPFVSVQYTKMDIRAYREKLVERIRNGKGPDIFRFHNTWTNMIREVLTPLPKSIMSNKDFEETFYPIFQKDLKIGNDYVGIPLYIDNLVLLYNKELLNKAGISVPPKTWDDIITYAPRLTVVDQNNTIINAGIALGTAENIDHFSDILGLLFLQNGVDIKTINSSEGIQVLEFYRKFAEKPNNVWDETMPSSINAFATQKVAMIFAPSWQIHTIRAINPELQFGAIPVPIVPQGQPVTLATYWAEGVSRGSKNQLEAWKFVRYLSEKETMLALYKEQVKTRIFGEPYSRIDLAKELLGQDYVGAVVEQATNSKTLPVVSRTFDNGLNDEIIIYLRNAINSTINGLSYKEALDVAQKGIQQVLTKFNYL